MKTNLIDAIIQCAHAAWSHAHAVILLIQRMLHLMGLYIADSMHNTAINAWNVLATQPAAAATGALAVNAVILAALAPRPLLKRPRRNA